MKVSGTDFELKLSTQERQKLAEEEKVEKLGWLQQYKKKKKGMVKVEIRLTDCFSISSRRLQLTEKDFSTDYFAI